MSGEGLRGQGCFQMKHSSQAGGGAGAAQVGWRQQMEEAKPQDVQGTSTPAHHAGGRLRRVEFAQAMDSGTPPPEQGPAGAVWPLGWGQGDHCLLTTSKLPVPLCAGLSVLLVPSFSHSSGTAPGAPALCSLAWPHWQQALPPMVPVVPGPPPQFPQ